MEPCFAQWRALTLDTLRPLLPPGQPCALVGYPNHWNPGDSAIWCGTRKLLNHLRVPIRYVCHHQSYRRAELQAALPDGPILFHGGGNFGDVYPDECGLRRRIFEDFPDREIIQLPQSIWFQSPGGVEDMARRIGRMKRFTLITRESASESFARRHFPCPVTLCPDLALWLDPADFQIPPADLDRFGLLRLDREAPPDSLRDLEQIDFPHQDWLIPGPEVDRWRLAARLFLRFDAWLAPLFLNHALTARRLFQMALPGYERLALLRAQRGVRFLCRGRILVTNRLHGHLLGLLTGRPQVITDTLNGKIRAFYESWTHLHPSVHWAENLIEARKIADRLSR